MNTPSKTPPSQPCPICGAPLPFVPRYPRYLCRECAAEATDETGRKLAFSNATVSGGFVATYADTGEPRASHICYVRGIPCRADEARFGGIVIQTQNTPEAGT